MARDPETFAHQEWIGYVQPVGLVVSIPALTAAQSHVNRNIAPDQQKLLGCLPHDAHDEPIPEIQDFPKFTQEVLGWEPADLVPVNDGDPQTCPLIVALPEYNDTLRPTYAVKEVDPKEGQSPWLMLVQLIPTGADFDKIAVADERQWQATPQHRFERLLRETEVPTGLLANGTHLRLVYAPRGETSGYATFPVAHMAQVAGRPIFAALHMLLCAERVFGFGLAYPDKQRLSGILADSRKYQNVVSTKLAEQVLAALYELVRGFQAADDQRHGELLREVLADDPDHVYGGLLTVLMRLVFVLYAEDRGLLSNDPIYANFYSVTGLFERLRADAGRYPDTMDQRYGAWAQLLTLFRLIYDGGRHAGLHIPARRGYLFDPDRFNFLEGRPYRLSRANAEARPEGNPPIPNVSDGVVYRVLQNLLILDGERLSYRTLDVEQIGSVYEAVMGFNLQVAQGRSIAIKPKKPHGAPAAINLETLLAIKAADRAKWVVDQSDQKITGKDLEALKQAGDIDGLLAALDGKIAHNVTPGMVPKGAMVLQPSDERRRSGAHYTPRSLTEPIVRTTLRPVLERLGPSPTPEQILDLKVCDPAEGSGAFLVEACRQLGDELVRAWHVHNRVPKLPPDEDEILYARRLVAQRCLYGVDRNPMAVDLAKLSLWLATLAKDHPFTFLDHCLRAGDSLVGLSQEQIAAFHWKPQKQRDLFRSQVEARMRRVMEYRQQILAAREDVPYEQLRQQLDVADEQLSLARLAGDLVIAAFFAAGKDKQREQKLDELADQVNQYLGSQGKMERRVALASAVQKLRSGKSPITPFHWQVEFPEVFLRANPGFDAIVGNPPFMGGKRISGAQGKSYAEWIVVIHEGTNGNADLVAHFFRRAFSLLRTDRAFGLIATNTIAQGDTRRGGLRWIATNGGTIFNVRRRLRWPGAAAVVVSVVSVLKGMFTGLSQLDDAKVSFISAFFLQSGGHDDPKPLLASRGLSFIGCDIKGQGFLFDDGDPVSTSVARMKAILADEPRYAERILPYIGGEEINASPDQSNTRWVISFGELSEDQARKWPKLMEILEEKVRPDRASKSRDLAEWPWWQFWRVRRDLYEVCSGLDRVLVCPIISNKLSFVFKDSRTIFSHKLVVFPLDKYSEFAVLQSNCHGVWAWTFSSTMKDDLNYSPSDCFETFPLPLGFATDSRLESVGRDYYEYRAATMLCNNQGLTTTYTRFHDPDETSPDILKLRKLHETMDRTVLETYGWNDLAEGARYEHLLDYEEEEDEEENGGGRTRKKPWRYRWPDDFRDEVLARLLALNQERAQQESLGGKGSELTPKTRRKRTKTDGDKAPRLPGM